METISIRTCQSESCLQLILFGQFQHRICRAAISPLVCGGNFVSGHCSGDKEDATSWCDAGDPDLDERASLQRRKLKKVAQGRRRKHLAPPESLPVGKL